MSISGGLSSVSPTQSDKEAHFGYVKRYEVEAASVTRKPKLGLK